MKRSILTLAIVAPDPEFLKAVEHALLMSSGPSR